MMDDVIRPYEHGRFSNIPVPDWFERAVEISSSERVGWQHAVSRAFGAEHQGLTVDATGPIGLDISFWQSPRHGVYVEIDSGLDMIEQVLIPELTDWLPFMSAHLVPLVSAAVQMETAHQIDRLTNAVIAWARHGEGDHIDRCNGRSRIDEERDAAHRARLRART
jgi:hypothetical protein